MASNQNQPSSSDAVLCSQSSEIQRYNFYSNVECLNTIRGHLEGIIFLVVSPDNQTIVSGSRDKIGLWHLKTGQKIRTLIKVSGRLSVIPIAISADGQTLACGNLSGIIKVWNLKTGQQIHTFKGHSASIVFMALNFDGQTLATSDGEGAIKIWNLKKNEKSDF